MPASSPLLPASALLRRIFAELGTTTADGPASPAAPSDVPLPSRLSTGDLAWASVSAVTSLAGIRLTPDPERIALAYRSDRVLTVDGVAPDVWSPYSGFWQAEDGWIRTHGNYPHHAAALLAGIGLPPDADGTHLRDAISRRTVRDAVGAITAARGLAVAVRSEDADVDRAMYARPLFDISRIGDGEQVVPGHRAADPDRPLAGTRVLDLTRVIAGPVCTRTLALLGADVLRVDPPHLPEPDWQHFDTGHGKRSTRLDARSDAFRHLLDAADVVVLGYRPGSLARLGLSPATLAARHPGLVIAQLSAWGLDDTDRAGFDSLVQAESGIAMVESPDGTTPGALPAQALDHSAGYLLAAAVIALLDRRRREGGTWHVHTSLRRVAAELLRMPRRTEPARIPAVATRDHTTSFRVDGHEVTTARPALPGLEFSAPRPWGSDQPVW